MRLSKRSLMLLVCLVTATTLTVAGTLAYLTDTAEVTNTFTVGKVDLKLEETEVNEDGTPVNDPPTRAEKGNNYHLIPGMTYTKDPLVTVLKGSEESYIRMKVTITDYEDLERILAKYGKTFELGVITDYNAETSAWQMPENYVSENGVYEYRYNDIVDAKGEEGVLYHLFTTLTVPGEFTSEDMNDLAELEIKVTAEAIQAATFADDDAAWAAFDAAVGNNQGGNGEGEGEGEGEGGDQPGGEVTE